MEEEFDIDERLACHYFCPRQPSFPGNVDQYGKRQLYTVMQGTKYYTVMHGTKCCLAKIVIVN